MRKLYLKLWLISLLFLGSMLLTACQAKEPFEATYQNEFFTIDPQNQTVEHDGQTYRYELSGNTLTIAYPNGASYWQTTDGNGSYGGWNDLYAETSEQYVDGGVLENVILQYAASRSNKNNAGKWAGIIAVLIGLWSLFFPRAAWFIEFGWRYRNAEPSGGALIFQRSAGVILLIAGIFLLFL